MPIMNHAGMVGSDFMNKPFVIGTAGHIDHGKTTLVKALTGTDTDRLKEEKERGITTDLGFAFLPTPSGGKISMVDVPGHEKFIRTMVAGASGIDAVLLCIAADEGIMPQTREHLEICELLGLREGVVAVTKSDLLDDVTLEVSMEEIRDYLKKTPLNGSPLIPVSAKTGKGMEELKAGLFNLYEKAAEKVSDGPLYFIVDRSFTKQGFGTVVTGVLLSGRVEVGQSVEVLPGGLKSKVRGIHSHNEEAREARTGQRAAINIAGLEKAGIKRGAVLAEPGVFREVDAVFAEAMILGSAKAIKKGGEISFHTGTSGSLARIYPVQGNRLELASKALVRIRMDEKIPFFFNQRFILRSFAYGATIGGGRILWPEEKIRKREEAVELLTSLSTGSREEILLSALDRKFPSGVEEPELRNLMAFSSSETKSVVEILVKTGRVAKIRRGGEGRPDLVIGKKSLDSICGKIKELAGNFHREKPGEPGAEKPAILAGMKPPPDEAVFNAALDNLLRSGEVAAEGGLIRLKSHARAAKKELSPEEAKLFKIYDEAGLATPTVKDAAARSGLDEKKCRAILEGLKNSGKLIRVSLDLYYSAEKILKLKSDVTEYLKKNGEIDAQAFKNMTGLTRKFAIPILEWFDQERLTLRVGDKRVLR